MLEVYIITIIVSFIVAFLATPLVRKFAYKIGAIDVPKDERRMHKIPTPRIGGLAIVIGVLVGVLYNIIKIKLETGVYEIKMYLIGYMVGAVIIALIGFFDDIKPMKAWVKLIGQIAAAVCVVVTGVEISHFTNPFTGEIISLHYLAIPLTIFWIVGVTNAINFIDGLDGLAAGVCTIASLSLLFIFVFTNQTLMPAILVSSLAGATMGFLPFNFNPAKIFMGDTGSNFLGFSLATIAVIGITKIYTAVIIVIPIVILGLPLFDTSFAILRRIIHKKSPMEADRGHLHHRLIDAGLSTKQAVLILYGISTFLGVCSVVLIQNNTVQAFVLVIALSFFVVAGILKYIHDKKNEMKEEIEKLEENGR